MTESDCKHEREDEGSFLKCKECNLTVDVIQSKEYKNEPLSIGEARSNKFGSTAKDWTPRDALVHVIRLIDNKEIDPSTLIVGYTNKKDGGVSYTVSSRHDEMRTYIIGLLHRIMYLINNY